MNCFQRRPRALRTPGNTGGKTHVHRLNAVSLSAGCTDRKVPGNRRAFRSAGARPRQRRWRDGRGGGQGDHRSRWRAPSPAEVQGQSWFAPSTGAGKAGGAGRSGTGAGVTDTIALRAVCAATLEAVAVIGM